MISLFYPSFGLSLQFSDKIPIVVCIEKPSMFRKFLKDLHSDLSGETEQFLLVNGEGRKQNLSVVAEVISDPTNINFNTRKVMGALSKEAIQICTLRRDLLTGLSNVIDEFASSLIQELPYLSIDSDTDLSITTLLKLCGLHFEPTLLQDDLSIIEWIRISSRLLRTQLLILVNGSSFFSEEELDAVAEIARSSHMYLLILEADSEKAFEKGDKVIIDSDMCIIDVKTQ